ncbi:MAG: hypothetical protein IJX28_02460 [Clostridia bacterium]|nr:hypothetical protein [Clostridia bacterium]
MKLDKRMLDRLLTMNDEQLTQVIQSIATEAGIDPATLGLQTDQIQALRAALGGATEEDLQRMGEVYQAYRQNRRSP